MTISTEPAPLSYSGNGSTTDFAITWRYNAKSHVVVTLRDANDDEATQVLATDYTLTAAGVDSGGTLTMTTAPATGETLVIELEPPNTQDTDLPVGGQFPSESVEDELDEAAQRDAKIEAFFNRALRVPRTDTQSGTSLEFPIDADRADKLLGFTATGVPTAIAKTLTDTAVDISGHTVVATGSTTATELEQRFANVANVVDDFGAVGDYISGGAINGSPTDNLAAFQAAFAANNNVVVPTGYYYVSDKFSIPRFGTLEGLDNEAVHIIGENDCLNQPLGTDNITVKDIRFDSVNQGVALNTGTPAGNDYSSDNTFERCIFGDSLSYMMNGKAQLLKTIDCEFRCPIRITAGNYPTFVRPKFIFSSVSTEKSTIAGVEIGAAGGAYFAVAAYRHDDGHSSLLESPWFEHIPACAALFGPSVISWEIRNPRLERVCNATNSQALNGGGWMISSDDSTTDLSSAKCSGGGVIGNVGTDSDGNAFTPDALGIFGGTGVKKMVAMGVGATFFESAKAPSGGFKMFEHLPKWASGCGQGDFANTGIYAITIHHSDREGYFKARLASTQTFTAGQFDKANATSETIDVEGWYDTANKRYTPISAFPCIVEFDAKAWLDGMVDGKTLFLALYKNGSIYEYFDRTANGTDSTTNLLASGAVTATANGSTDYFELFVRQDDTVDRDSFADANAVVFSGRIVAFQAA